MLVSAGLLGLIGAVGLFVWALFTFGQDLPDYSQLADYKPAVVTLVHAGDGRLMAEFATEKRLFVPINAVPARVIDAFLSAEDKNFYHHEGLDIMGIVRAMFTNIQNIGSGRRPVGASTITQQVAKNFLLTNEVSIERKIKEAILAFRLERAYTKEQILELYLNEIYLGGGSYGVAAAALNYFNKSLDELSIPEAAYLAALPKAPSNYHPIRRYDAAMARRNWVIERMADDGYITKSEAEIAMAKPLITYRRNDTESVNAPYFAEEVRRILIDKYGEDSLYRGGLSVRATIEPRLQTLARKALRDGLIDYDRRRGGWRGPVAHVESLDDWPEKIKAVPAPPGAEDWEKAAVLSVGADQAGIGFADGTSGVIRFSDIKWARKKIKGQGLGPTPEKATDVLSKGDIVMVEDTGEKHEKDEAYHLRQVPIIQGALIAMDPYTGRVLAMQGGFSYEISEFNRVTQAQRQPGSAFKPFVYLTALEKGFTPATLVMDTPVVFEQGPGLPKWRPQNYSEDYLGPTPLRVGLEKSRNLMTVRLANYVGMDTVVKRVREFGLMDNLPPHLSMSLGAGETTLLRMATAYASFVNGGKKVIPTFIDRIQDRSGKTIFNHDTRHCDGCGPMVRWEETGAVVPDVPDTREQIIDPRYAYQIVSILEGVVQRGTAVKVKALNRPVAGKTGTTNDSKDAWFMGFTPDLLVGVYMGFDNPHTLGAKETGSSVAAPVFLEFMQKALKDKPPSPFRVPPGIRMVQIDATDGTRAQPGDEKVIWEAFLAGTEPTEKIMMLDGSSIRPAANLGGPSGEAPTTGTGGLY